ncbi:hypothetical protein D3C85_1090530 [compost metagenome]
MKSRYLVGDFPSIAAHKPSSNRCEPFLLYFLNRQCLEPLKNRAEFIKYCIYISLYRAIFRQNKLRTKDSVQAQFCFIFKYIITACSGNWSDQ